MVLPINNVNSYLEESAIAGVTPTDYSNCTSYMEAAFTALQEQAENWNMFNTRLAMNEAAYLQENGVEIVYEDAEQQGLIAKGVAIVKSWLSKVLGTIKKFITEVSAKVANMTKWVGLSKKKLNGNLTSWPENKKIEDYDYTAAAKKIAGFEFIATTGNVFDKFGTTDVQKVENHAGNFNRAIAYSVKTWTGKEDGKCTLKEIKDNVLGQKTSIRYTAQECIDVITGFKSGIKSVNDAASEAKSVANNMIKSLNELKKSVRSNSAAGADEKKSSATTIYKAITAVNQINTANTTLLTAKLSILIGQLNLNKRVAAVYLGAASKEERAAKKDERAAKKTEKATKKNDKDGVVESAVSEALDFAFV